MKRLLYVVLALAALAFSFSVENLTEHKRQDEFKYLDPDRLVERLMRDSLQSLENRAVTMEDLAAGVGDESFSREHGRVLGIGSPTFYVIKGKCDNATVDGEAIHATVGGIELIIPLRYIFGNTARDASGWFNIDEFQNTMDFNSVSAAMNAYIATHVRDFSPNGEVSFLGAVAVKSESNSKENLSQGKITLIPYQLK